MQPLLKKLQFKNQEVILVLNSPDEFKDSIIDFKNYTKVITEISGGKAKQSFILVFVKDIDGLKQSLEKIRSLINEESILWFAYPKKASKKYKSDINRDFGWQALGDISFEGVRQIAIDEDWSALRFRYISQIKKFSRNKNMVLSGEGKIR